MSISDFQILEKLGEGAYSSVFKVMRKADRAEYALKKVRISKLSDKEKSNALNEVRLLASVKHPNVISYREAFLDEFKSLCIVMEYADGGDLFQLISAGKKRREIIPEERVWALAVQVLRGLKELHRCSILHRDLKSANIFLTKEGTAKLGDMNVSKVAREGMLQTQTGTPYYASPEVWREKPYGNKSDIWSLGCVLFEMCALKPPFRAEDMEGLYRKIVRGKAPPLPPQYSPQLQQLIFSMLAVNPERRPSCKQLLESEAVRARPGLSFEQPVYDSVMISTIRMPDSLYYLTDMLPRPNYGSPRQERRRPEEKPVGGKSAVLPKLRDNTRRRQEQEESAQHNKLKEQEARRKVRVPLSKKKLPQLK